jgi:hypothetical protein
MKKKSFIYQTWWIGLIPLLIGFIFMVCGSCDATCSHDWC